MISVIGGIVFAILWVWLVFIPYVREDLRKNR